LGKVNQFVLSYWLSYCLHECMNEWHSAHVNKCLKMRNIALLDVRPRSTVWDVSEELATLRWSQPASPQN
jgi:hypothetical protein